MDRTTPTFSLPHGPFWLICGMALAVRILYVLEIDASPLFTYPVVDGKTYLLHASSLAAGNWLGLGQGPFWQPPLYPYLLGLFKLLTSESAFFYAIRFFQAMLGAFTCGLVYLLGRRWFSPGIGLVAGLAACLYGPLIFFDGELLPACLATFLDLSGLLLLDRALTCRSPRYLLVAGLVFGLSSLAVASVLGFAVVLIIWLSWRYRSFTLTAALALGLLLAIAPVAWRNYAVGKELVLISYNAGVNFYIGNNAAYERTIKTRPGWEWDELISEPVKAGIQRPTEKSAYFWHKAWQYIRTHPVDYLGLLATKTWQLIHGDELGRNQDIYYWRNYSHLLSASVWKWGLAFPFGIISPLALLGLAVALKRKGLTLASLFVLSYSAGIIAFFPMARYRVPMIPLLLLLAAYGGWWLKQRISSGKRQTGAGAVALLVGLGLLTNLGGGTMHMEGDAEIHYNLGQAYANKRELPLAQNAFARSVTQDSTYWQAWLNLGSVTAIQGDMATADQIFRRVTQAHPDRAEVWVNLAHSSRSLGKLEAAGRAYEQALTINPYQPRIYAELLQLHFQRGTLKEAQQLLDRALALYPNDRQKLLTLYENMWRQYSAPQP